MPPIQSMSIVWRGPQTYTPTGTSAELEKNESIDESAESTMKTARPPRG